MRIVRTLILLGAAGLFLPSPPEDQSAKAPAAGEPSAFQMLTSAGAAASDAASFCSRQTEVCGVASYLTSQLTAKAVYSASLLWGYAGGADLTGLGGGADDAGPGTAMTVVTDSAQPDSSPVSKPSKGDSQSTLRLDDMIPEWRGPSTAAKKDG